MGKSFLMAGGGTGGHVIPALAVARELKERGHRVFFVGTQSGMEAKLVPAEGFELKTITIGGLNRVGLLQKLKTVARLPLTTLGCLKYAPEAVFSMGGYVAGPPVLAAIMRRTPVVVMEPNAVAGVTNRVIGRVVALGSWFRLKRRRAIFRRDALKLPDCPCARNSSASQPSRAVRHFSC